MWNFLHDFVKTANHQFLPCLAVFLPEISVAAFGALIAFSSADQTDERPYRLMKFAFGGWLLMSLLFPAAHTGFNVAVVKNNLPTVLMSVFVFVWGLFRAIFLLILLLSALVGRDLSSLPPSLAQLIQAMLGLILPAKASEARSMIPSDDSDAV